MRLLDLDEKLLPPARRLEWKFKSVLTLFQSQTLKQGLDRGRHWNREGSVFAAFRTRERDFVFPEIHTGKWNPSFPQSATRMKADVKIYLHPLRFLFQRFLNFDDFLVGQFRLFGRFVPARGCVKTFSSF